MSEKLTFFAYFPFIGWMLIFILKKDDEFAVHHAKQSLFLAFFFTVALILLIFSTVFIPGSYRLFKLIIVILIYLIYLLYFISGVAGTIMIKNREKGDFPLIKKYANRLEI